MVQLIAIIVREMTQRHKYRWHVTTETQVSLACNLFSVKQLFT